VRISVLARFLLGHPDSIRTVAASHASFWTGLILVLLTAIARNYDQTFILEKPFPWVLGPLLFSLFSGTWIFLVAYGIAWGYMDAERPPFLKAWPAFMGLFWMTAPIAWLYAIPVERLFDSVTAAWANVALLATVSLWRVILMARVFQVLHGTRFLMALSWVLIPVSVEVLALYFFGGGMAKRVMAGMMGMRNSPEEEVLLHAMGVALTAALWILPAAILSTIAWRMKSIAAPYPPRERGRLPWVSIGIAAALWIIAAIFPQREVARNATVDGLVAEGEFRKALDYLSARRRDEFAPSRTLPPKPFEREIFEQLSGLFGVVKTSDAPWVHDHLIMRLNQLCSHFTRPWARTTFEQATREERIKAIYEGMEWAQNYGRLDGAGFNSILDGLDRMPPGPRWLGTNELFLAALAKLAAGPDIRGGNNAKSQELQRAEWEAVIAHIAKLGITNSPVVAIP